MSHPNFKSAYAAPGWFTWAINAPVSQHQVTIAGCNISYLDWSGPRASRGDTRPGLLLLHGGGAHARWWQFIAPFFEQTHRVVAMDLSGMGDSGHREEYSIELRAQEVDALLDELDFGKDTVVVGHSLGGLITTCFAATFGNRVAGCVLVDSPVLPPDAQPFPQPPTSPKAHRIHPTLDAAVGRFRVVPTQPCDNDYILEFIAHHSLKRVGTGWQWKFDPVVFGPPDFGSPFREFLAEFQCPAAFVYGERSALVTASTASYMAGLLGPTTPVIAIPNAYHHVMLDEPLGFVCALRALFESWPSGQV